MYEALDDVYAHCGRSLRVIPIGANLFEYLLVNSKFVRFVWRFVRFLIVSDGGLFHTLPDYINYHLSLDGIAITHLLKIGYSVQYFTKSHVFTSEKYEFVKLIHARHCIVQQIKIKLGNIRIIRYNKKSVSTPCICYCKS